MAGRKVVSVILEAKTQSFVAGMRSAKASVDDLTAAAAPDKQAAFDGLSSKAAVAGGAIAVGLGVAVKKFAEFDSAMSAVAANSGSTGAELESLRQAALELGADTQFSATEAAEGINELSKAGVSAGDILGGGLKGSLDLAAAGQIGVGEAAETAATAMTQFNLEGSEIPHVADLLTNAANKAQGGVGDLAQALKQGGLVAASTGLTIDETTASLAAFASAGLIGSDAGTSLKTMLQRLSAPSKESAALMEKLGISAYDASGEFVGMESLAGQLQDGLGDLTAEQRNSALATIFGSDAVRAANILYAEGADGIANWTTEVTEQGAAAKQAAILTDNLQGDVERLGGAFDSAFIKTGSGANGALRTLVQGLTGLVDHIGKIPGPVLLAGSALTSLALVAPKAISSFRDYKADLNAMGLSLDKISTKAPRTARAIGAVGKAATGLAIGASIVGMMDEALAGIGSEQLIRDLDGTANALDVVNAAIAKADAGTSDVTSLGKALQVAFDPNWIDKTGSTLDGFFSVFGVEKTGEVAMATDRLKELDSTLAGMVSSGDADGAASLMSTIEAEASRLGISVEDLQAKFPLYAEAVAAAGNQSKLTGDDVAGMGNDMEAAEKAAEDLTNAIKGLGDATLGQRAGAREYQATLDEMAEALKENGRTLDISTEAGRANEAALDDLANTTQDWAAAVFEATGDAGKAQDILSKGRKQWLDYALAMGMPKREAKALADELFNLDGLDAKADVDVATEKATKKTKDFHDLITGTNGLKGAATVEESGAAPATKRVLYFTEAIRDLNGKTVSVAEVGSDPARQRVTKLDGAIFGLKGKQVEVTEFGSTAAGERVVGFQGKVYALKGKTVDVTARTHGEAALANLQRQINSMSGRNIDVNTYYREYRQTVDMGTYKARAAGGIDGIDPMAIGGMRAPGSVAPGLYGTSKRGILMAEDTRSRWEAYIPERPDLRPRAEAILEETARRFGKAVVPLEQITAMASGGITSRWQAQLRNVRSLSNQRRYRWEDGSRMIQVFEDGTARWRGWGAPPAAVSRAINALNAAQDRHEAELNRQEAARRQAQQRQARQRAAQQKAQQRAAAQQKAQQKAQQRQAQQKAAQEKAARRQAELQRRIAEQRRIAREGWSESTGKKYAGKSFVRSDSIKPSPHEGRTYVAPSVSSSRSSSSGSAGGIDGRVVGAQVAAAVGKEMRSWRPMVEISGQRFHGLMVKTKRDRKGR